MKWTNIDLPKLTSIDSAGWSFYNPHSVILESISEYWLLNVFRYSKSSKCQSTWFIPLCSIEINFKYCLLNLIWFLDVPSILADLVDWINLYFQHGISTLHFISYYSIGLSLFFQCFFVSIFVPDPLSSFFVHWFSIQSSIVSLPSYQIQIVVASMFRFFVVSLLRMKIWNCWEMKERNEQNRVWFSVETRYV